MKQSIRIRKLYKICTSDGIWADFKALNDGCAMTFFCISSLIDRGRSFLC